MAKKKQYLNLVGKGSVTKTRAKAKGRRAKKATKSKARGTARSTR